MKTNSHVETCYGLIDRCILNIARNIQLLICDVDGVMSNGLIYIGNNGELSQAFNVRDSYGIRCLLTAGIEVAIITGRSTKIIEERCLTLGIKYLYQGQLDKTLAFKELLTNLALTNKQIAYIGDDLIDIPVMMQVGLSIAVADAHPLLLNKVNYVTHNLGGHGAVREICDLLLIAQDKMGDIKFQ